MTIAPVTAFAIVEDHPADAFALFADGLGRWWPMAYTFSGPAFATAGVEERAGGDWYEDDQDGVRHVWGKVLAYEPPTRLVLTWAVGADRRPTPPDQASRVEITFAPADVDHTEVRLTHSDFEKHGADGERIREAMASPMGWALILAELRREARFD